jgi:hypothetical protein
MIAEGPTRGYDTVPPMPNLWTRPNPKARQPWATAPAVTADLRERTQGPVGPAGNRIAHPVGEEAVLLSITEGAWDAEGAAR